MQGSEMVRGFHVQHCCLVFELLDISLSDFLKKNKDQGILMRDIRTMTKQLLQCFSFLQAISLVHTDVKCRNVMLRDSRSDMVNRAGAHLTFQPALASSALLCLSHYIAASLPCVMYIALSSDRNRIVWFRHVLCLCCKSPGSPPKEEQRQDAEIT